MASAAGRARTNHGETRALSAAALMVPQPAPLRVAAIKSCHGETAVAQPTTPAPISNAPIFVTIAAPRRRCRRGRFAPVIAPERKCRLIAAEIRAIDQPLDSRITPRKMGGP